MDSYKKLIICKFEVLKILITNKNMEEQRYNILRNILITIDQLISCLKKDQTIDCTNDINIVEEYISKIK